MRQAKAYYPGWDIRRGFADVMTEIADPWHPRLAD
jgi:hypothetical protein